MSLKHKSLTTRTFINELTILCPMYKKRLEVGRSRYNSPECKLSRRGQVTIFIILGIILLLVVVLLLVLQREVTIFKPEEITFTQKGKVEQLISSCIEKVGDDGLFMLGLQAGYIQVPLSKEQDASKHLRISPMNVVPYWAYGEVTEIPSVEEMQGQLNTHLEQNLRSCVLELEPFQSSYDVTEKSAIEAKTEILDNKVLFPVKWDIEVKDKAGQVVSHVVDHEAESKTKLKRVYDAARRIVEKEMQTLKFEDLTQDLIALEHDKVPLMGMEVSCRKKQWKFSEARNTFKDMLRVNIQNVKIDGTKYAEFPESQPYYQSHYLWNLGEGLSKDVSVLFQFDNQFPFYMEVTPRQGEKMLAGQLGDKSSILSALCFQWWKFTYDVTYPVLVRVRDESMGYDFQTAFTVHLKRNIPNRKEGYAQSSHLFLAPVQDDDFCRESRIPMTVSTYELVENPQLGVYNREPLDDTEITFSCLRYTCNIGKTEYDYASRGDIAAYSSVFPYCVGGIMRATKESYTEAWERVVTEDGKQVELNLRPLMALPAPKIRIVKHELLDDIRVGQPVELRNNELALVKITAKLPNEQVHESQVVLSSSLDPQVIADQQLDFLAKTDFTYELEVQVMEEEKFISGYKGNWTVSWGELERARELHIHTIAHEEGSDDDRLTLAIDLEAKSGLVPTPEWQ